MGSGSRRFDREFRVSVLEYLETAKSENEACLKFHITKRELKRIMWWRKRVREVPWRKEMVAKEKTLRERLYERAVSSVAESLDPIEKIIESPVFKPKSPGEEPELSIDFLPTAVGHLRNRGQNAIKVLEGLGDFRRAGDDIPSQGPRQPLFNLPAGSHVAVRLDITTSQEVMNGNNSTNDRNPAIEAEITDSKAEGMDSEV